MKNDKWMNKEYKSAGLIGLICLVIILGILLVPVHGEAPANVDLSDYSAVNAICELATLKCFYHNVATEKIDQGTVEKVASYALLGPFGGIPQVGYKQYWMEYSGIVEIGIDVGQVQISSPNANGVVDVYVPDARVLVVSADENSFSEPIIESGWFTEFSAEEKSEVFSKEQSKMRQEVENDQKLLRRAKNNAMQLLKQYIVNTGKEIGVDYTVNWIDNPI